MGIQLIQSFLAQKKLNRVFLKRYLRACFEKERKYLLDYFSKKSTPLAKKVKAKAPQVAEEAIEDMLAVYLELKKHQQLHNFYIQQIRYLTFSTLFMDQVNTDGRFLELQHKARHKYNLQHGLVNVDFLGRKPRVDHRSEWGKATRLRRDILTRLVKQKEENLSKMAIIEQFLFAGSKEVM